MLLEKYVADLNANIFLREFSFSKNLFNPLPDQEREFADHVIWIDDLLMVYQLKEREKSVTHSGTAEAKWFEKKVLGKATKQIRDTLKYLSVNNNIEMTNQRGHTFKVHSRNVKRMVKLVLYAANEKLPNKYRGVKHHVSSTAGFIHILPIQDYIDICQTLLIPAEITEYFDFRERVISRWSKHIKIIAEPALVGQFLYGDSDVCPNNEYINYSISLKNDVEEFDNSYILYNFAEHIEHSSNQNDKSSYYKILAEFAKLTRGEHKEIKARVKLCLQKCDTSEVVPPYRLIAPSTGCGYIFIPLPRDMTEHRLNALQNFTLVAKYDRKLQRCVGVSFAKDEEDFLIDWLFADFPWKHDPEMASLLQEKYPFRELKSKPFVRYEFGNSDSS